MTDTDTISATVKPSEEQKQMKEKQNSEHVGHSVAVQYGHTLLQYMGKRGLESNDILRMKISEIFDKSRQLSESKLHNIS